MKLRIAAKIPHRERGYFVEHLEPMTDGDQIELIGEVNDASKQEFLAQAAALLFPIDWPEPFGLVMIESMACGTPVIAFRQGSVPEIIEHGVSGFIVDDEAEAVEAVHRLSELNRREVRASFERRFTSSKMATAYLRCYDKIIADAADHPILDKPVRRRQHASQTIKESAEAMYSNAFRSDRQLPTTTRATASSSSRGTDIEPEQGAALLQPVKQ